MTRQIKGLLYFFAMEIRYSLTIFWTILLLFLVLSLGIAYFMLGLDGFYFTFGFPFATYIHAGILGFTIVKDYIPFSLKLGAVRKNIFLGIGLFLGGYALFMALISSTIQAIVTAGAVNLDSFSFLHPVKLFTTDTWFNRITVDTMMIFTIAAVMFLLGLLFYRGGLIAGGSVVGVVSLVLLFGFAEGFLLTFFQDIYLTEDILFFGKVFVIGLVVYGIAYFLLRGITTVKAR